MTDKEFCKITNWYPIFANKTFMTSFVKLREDAVEALAKGEGLGVDNAAVEATLKDLRSALANVFGNSFVSVDLCAPTDTDRYLTKRGATYSAESSWNNLVESEKVRNSAKNGDVESIIVRPFRRINRTREFRLFVKDKKLVAMSQYHLVRHFRRLEGIKEKLWQIGLDFVNDISWNLPVNDIVIDIYITSEDEVLIVDFNPWGGDTNPLMLNTWERDWSQEIGIVLMPVPVSISGDLNISF